MSNKDLITIDYLLENGSTVAELVDRIETEGIISKDRYGRFGPAEDYAIDYILECLAAHHLFEHLPLDDRTDYGRSWGARHQKISKLYILTISGWRNYKITSTTDDHLIHSKTMTIEYNSQAPSINPVVNDDFSQDFDPLPLSGIAKMFPLTKDKEINLEKWRTYASKASQNKLSNTRASKGRGRAESTFHPHLVADWLVTKGYYERAHADRILGNNLPPRSKHLKDYYTSS